jgi:hypothetical protein
VKVCIAQALKHQIMALHREMLCKLVAPILGRFFLQAKQLTQPGLTAPALLRSSVMTTVSPSNQAKRTTRSRAYSSTPSAVASSGTHIVRLSDPEMRPAMDALRKRLTSDPAAARQWLQDLGYLTAAGNVTRRYGGR